MTLKTLHVINYVLHIIHVNHVLHVIMHKKVYVKDKGPHSSTKHRVGLDERKEHKGRQGKDKNKTRVGHG